MSKKGDIKEMASLVGNSAAHVAVYREGAEKEVSVYMSIASEVAEGRTWNEREIEDFREKAVRRAGSVIRERIRRGDLGEKEFDEALKRAGGHVARFAEEELHHRGRGA